MKPLSFSLFFLIVFCLTQIGGDGGMSAFVSVLLPLLCLPLFLLCEIPIFVVIEGNLLKKNTPTDVPHPGIGSARRLQVQSREQQHRYARKGKSTTSAVFFWSCLLSNPESVVSHLLYFRLSCTRVVTVFVVFVKIQCDGGSSVQPYTRSDSCG